MHEWCRKCPLLLRLEEIMRNWQRESIRRIGGWQLYSTQGETETAMIGRSISGSLQLAHSLAHSHQRKIRRIEEGRAYLEKKSRTSHVAHWKMNYVAGPPPALFRNTRPTVSLSGCLTISFRRKVHWTNNFSTNYAFSQLEIDQAAAWLNTVKPGALPLQNPDAWGRSQKGAPDRGCVRVSRQPVSRNRRLTRMGSVFGRLIEGGLFTALSHSQSKPRGDIKGGGIERVSRGKLRARADMFS